ncbi:hypothetical protein Bbelb_060390 [Branchiostoma belcheri]|nr:hypothetical protein Bbelb_060390 [Branchiostoma belcheri]
MVEIGSTAPPVASVRRSIAPHVIEANRFTMIRLRSLGQQKPEFLGSRHTPKEIIPQSPKFGTLANSGLRVYMLWRNPEQQRVGRRQNIDNRLWIYVSFSATRATGKLTIYKLCDSNHLNWTCTSIVCITQTLLSAALLAPPAGCWAADRAQQKEGETRRRRTTHSSSDMEKGIGTSGTRTERDQETRTNKPFRNTRARAQIVHVKPPPDTPSSFEATDVYIPGPETSVPDPDRTVGRGQKVSLRRVPA